MTDTTRAIDAQAMTALAERALDGDAKAESELLRQGGGSVEALRAIYETFVTDCPDALGAAKMEVVARMIASKTGADRDWRCVSACMTVQALEFHRCGNAELADETAFDAVCILRRLVDGGDGEALLGLAHFPPQFTHLCDIAERSRPSAIVPDGLADSIADRLEAASAASAPASPPLARWEGAKLWAGDRWWRLQFVGWAFADLGRAFLDLFRR